MEELFKKRKEYEAGGGKHDMYMNAQCRLSELHLCKKKHLKYIKLYSDYLVFDGTHHMSM